MEHRETRTFLTADWRDLVFVSYFVADEVLTPYLPAGIVLDRFEGKAVATLAAFRFLETRLGGWRPPLFHSFAELNLRFYARDIQSGKRGVVFIREVCPYRAVAWTARLLFNERFTIRRCRCEAREHAITYHFGNPGAVTVDLTSAPYLPKDASLAHFLTDRYHGFTRFRRGGTLYFDVAHPPWAVREAALGECTLDRKGLFGAKIAEALSGEPCAVLYAAGSSVDLSWGRVVRAPAKELQTVCPQTTSTL